MTITLYTQDQCPPCQYIKNMLTARGLSFIEKNIKHQKYRIEMIDLEAYSTPLLIINDRIFRSIDMTEIEHVLQEVEK